jgi:arylsulfatase
MSKKRPNILLIMTDQQRHDTIGALGNTKIRTPHLDNLVKQGVAFTNAYSPAPVCVPARSAMHYGQYPGNTCCLGNMHPTTPDDRDSYVDVLTRGGYDTMGIGKCHFVPDRLALRGFRRRLTQEETPNRIEDDDYLQYIQQSFCRNVRDVHGAWRELLYMPQTSPLDAEHHPTQWVGDRILDYIGERADHNSPWFAMCSFIHPHPPYAPPVPWDTLYEPDDLDDPYLPADYQDRQPAFKRAQLHHYYFDPPTSSTLWRMIKARYYSCVSFVDHQIGRVQEALAATGQLDNTLILFTSDHGEMLGDLGMIGKANMYGPSVKVPLLARWGDGRHAGDRVDIPVSLVDIGTTILLAAGLPVPATFEGEDLQRIAAMPNTYNDRIIYSQVFNPDRGMYLSVNRRFKYIHSAADGSEQLFDYRSDPHEDVNMINDPAYEHELVTLREAMFDYLRRTGQDQVLDKCNRRWRSWPQSPIIMERTTSNDPCSWWDHKDKEPDDGLDANWSGK